MTIPDVLPEYNSLTDSQKINILGIGLTDVKNRTNAHEKILILGDPIPLPERVRIIEKFQGNLEYWAKFIGGALFLNFLGFATGIFIAVVKFLPVLERLASKP